MLIRQFLLAHSAIPYLILVEENLPLYKYLEKEVKRFFLEHFLDSEPLSSNQTIQKAIFFIIIYNTYCVNPFLDRLRSWAEQRREELDNLVQVTRKCFAHNYKAETLLDDLKAGVWINLVNEKD